MTCDDLSDKMPAVARGADTWSAEEADHLLGCASCRAEWEAVSVGASVAHGTSIDADALAASVLRRLRTEPVTARFPRRRWLVGLATAAILTLILVPRNTPVPPPGGPTAAPLAVDVPGLGALDAEELADVLDALDTGWTETSTTDAPSLDDLDPQELERVERAWEI